ncbi:MAG TPA: hypothetical protein VHH72_01505 [Solirubrobacterales bacterium]|nr:hypothetical protein [Solirubrobacterales bacterium]
MTGAAAALLLASCGEEKTFTVEEFVDGVNDQGVALQLGEELFSDDEGKRVYAVELEPVAQLPGQRAGHSGGSISVYDDPARAESQLESCRGSADLLCYQAANVVVVLEGGGIEAQQLGIAIQRLEAD